MAREGNVWVRRRQILTSKGYLKLGKSHPCGTEPFLLGVSDQKMNDQEDEVGSLK